MTLKRKEAFRVNKSKAHKKVKHKRKLVNRKRRIWYPLRDINRAPHDDPMFTACNIHYELPNRVWGRAPGGSEGKGVRNLLCEAPSGPYRQKVPDPFSLPVKTAATRRARARTAPKVFLLDRSPP